MLTEGGSGVVKDLLTVELPPDSVYGLGAAIAEPTAPWLQGLERAE